VRQARNRWEAARAQPFLGSVQHFTCPSLTFLTGTLLKGLRVLQWLAHGSNGSHAALITPGMRVQKLDELLGGGLSIKSQPSP